MTVLPVVRCLQVFAFRPLNWHPLKTSLRIERGIQTDQTHHV
jgi:hypothetical protein